jgi:DNA-binding NarL/FixJ family response regulator
MLEGRADIAVVGTASGVDELAGHLMEGPVDAVLLEETEGESADIIAALASAGAALVVLGDRREAVEELAGSSLAGWGYLLAPSDPDQIAAALLTASAGLVALNRSLALALAPAHGSVPAPHVDSQESLTGREREVLQLMAQGLANKQIAARLSISLHTVKFHVASILAKLGASSRTEAVSIGARHGQVVL